MENDMTTYTDLEIHAIAEPTDDAFYSEWTRILETVHDMLADGMPEHTAKDWRDEQVEASEKKLPGFKEWLDRDPDSEREATRAETVHELEA
jgi:hypothetical protein